MSDIPSELKYTDSHEWMRAEDDGSITIGITAHAQELLGDLVYVELPEVGNEVDLKQEFAVVESVKAASDVYSPMAGEILAVNEELADAPETVNNDPYNDGWIARIRPADAGALDDMLDAGAYAELLKNEEH